jgi:hypothetical protein
MGVLGLIGLYTNFCMQIVHPTIHDEGGFRIVSCHLHAKKCVVQRLINSCGYS